LKTIIAYFDVSTAEFLSVLHATIEQGRHYRCAIERPASTGEFKRIAAAVLSSPFMDRFTPGRRPRGICYGGASLPKQRHHCWDSWRALRSTRQS
jgi:hypothetical protein